MLLVAAPDKFRGTLDARDAAAAIASAARRAGWDVDELPLSDGGEGFSSVLAGESVTATARGPLGDFIEATYLLVDDGRSAYIEMAAAAGRSLLPHPAGSQPLDATTAGVADLILDAASRGVRQIVVGCGGSATTDGGLGMLAAIDAAGGIEGIELIAATDVTTHYCDAAKVFAPQKGATAEQVDLLSRRLAQSAEVLDSRAGRSISTLDRSGAAGGLAGALMAIGATATSGLSILAGVLDLDARLRRADMVITGEGRLDATSLQGKVVGELLERTPAETPLTVIAGEVAEGVSEAVTALRTAPTSVISLTELVGSERSSADTAAALAEAVATLLA